MEVEGCADDVQEYYDGLLDHKGRAIVSQGPRNPRLRKLESAGEFIDSKTERALWYTLRQWGGAFQLNRTLSENDALQTMRMKALRSAKSPKDPNLNGLSDSIRAYLRKEGYHTQNKGHFLAQPAVVRLEDDPESDPNGETGEEKLEQLLIDRAEEEELEKKASRWFLTGVFWEYVKADPDLKRELRDIAEAKTWSELAQRWGYATRGGAERHARGELRKRLLTLADGKAARVLFQLHRL